MKRRQFVSGTAALLGTVGAFAQTQPAAASTIKIGLINDQSGVYRDVGGPTSVHCMKQAIEEFTSQNASIKVEVMVADHQNKPDIAGGIARQWIDTEGVDMIVDGGATPCSFLISTICREKNKVFVCSGSGSVDLTNDQCSPNTVQWVYDTHALSKTIGQSILKAGGDSWYYIAPNYVFGQELARNTAQMVQAGGGKNLGQASYPFPETTDFSSQLLQARSSGAKVLALCGAGADIDNCVKQAREFGLMKNMRVVAMLMFSTNVHAIGLDTAAGLYSSEGFYWDLNPRTRAFMQRIKSKVTLWPNMLQVGAYSGTLHYLKAVADLGVAKAKANGAETVARMKAMPTDDDCYGKGSIRADGRKIHPFYLFQVKNKSESSGPWDLFKVITEVPGPDVFRPLSESTCKFLKT
jgi:branched-chain amino acid transport system substrate-binding protein